MTRKLLTEEEKARAEAGMFADVPGEVVETTADEQYWRTRSVRSSCVEGAYEIYCDAMTGLHELRVAAIERYAASVIGEPFRAVRAAIRKTYPSHTYWADAWKSLLTKGHRVIFGWVSVPGLSPITQWNKDGSKTVPTGAFPPDGWAPPLSPDKFNAMFPIVEARPLAGPEPDDGGLFDRVMERIRQGRAA